MSAGRLRQAMATWLLGMLLVGAPDAALPQARRVAEYEVKAAFLFQFTRFVQWPDTGDAAFRICVWGSDPFGPALDAVAGARVGARAIVVDRPETTAALAGCQLIYVSADAPGGPEAALRALAGRAALSVASEPGFANAGGGIEFVIRDNRVRMIVNGGVIRGAGLRASAKLLEVAERVLDEDLAGR